MSTPYCTPADINLGNLMYADEGLEAYINEAADEIDGKLGWLYQTPIDMDIVPRHEAKMLKTICRKIATGRAISTLAIPAENGAQHAYGLRLLQEGLDELHMIAGGDVPLSAPRTDLEGDPNEPDGAGHGAQDARTPTVLVADSESMLTQFHRSVFGGRPSFTFGPDDLRE
jgi:hypothetical protein